MYCITLNGRSRVCVVCGCVACCLHKNPQHFINLISYLRAQVVKKNLGRLHQTTAYIMPFAK